MQTAVAAATILVTMGILDAIWLVSATKFYRRELPGLLADSPSMLPAAAFYLIYAVAVVVLVVVPSLDGGRSIARVALTGGLLGLAAYGTYDLTNQATVKGWSWRVTLVDLTWGTALTATVCVVAVLVARRFA